jgi:hypothetical protein
MNSGSKPIQATDPVDIVLDHPLLYEPITLLTQAYSSGKRLARVFDQLIERAYQYNQITVKRPFELFKYEPGEWVISLMELFPQILLPAKKESLAQTKLSWWSPSRYLCYSVFLSVILGLFVTLSAPYLGFTIALLSITSLISTRETLLIESHSQELIWRRNVLGILTAEKRLDAPLWVKLEHDLYAPNGRSVTIGSSKSLTSLNLGQPWDAFWIYQEIDKVLLNYKPKY